MHCARGAAQGDGTGPATLGGSGPSGRANHSVRRPATGQSSCGAGSNPNSSPSPTPMGAIRRLPGRGGDSNSGGGLANSPSFGNPPGHRGPSGRVGSSDIRASGSWSKILTLSSCKSAPPEAAAVPAGGSSDTGGSGTGADLSAMRPDELAGVCRSATGRVWRSGQSEGRGSWRGGSAGASGGAPEGGTNEPSGVTAVPAHNHART